jgi:hypothetical protein
MEIEKEDAREGDGVAFLLYSEHSSTILERGVHGVRLDYVTKDGQHKRDQWIPFSCIISCTRSDVDGHTKDRIIKELKYTTNDLS